jgi:hypothetical protein
MLLLYILYISTMYILYICVGWPSRPGLHLHTSTYTHILLYTSTHILLHIHTYLYTSTYILLCIPYIHIRYKEHRLGCAQPPDGPGNPLQPRRPHVPPGPVRLPRPRLPPILRISRTMLMSPNRHALWRHAPPPDPHAGVGRDGMTERARGGRTSDLTRGASERGRGSERERARGEGSERASEREMLGGRQRDALELV